MTLRAFILTVALIIPFFAMSQKTDQTITFGVLSAKTFGDASFELSAKATSGLAVSYSSSNIQVATISGTTVTIVGAGQTSITAKQIGNDTFNPAPDVTQALVISKADQIITFSDPGDLSTHTYGDQPFSLGFSSTSGLPLSFTVNNPQIGVVSGGNFFITTAGECTVTVSQAGNNNYQAAVSVRKVVFIRKAIQAISFPAFPLKTYGNPTFDPSAKGSSGLAVVYTTSDPTVAVIQNNRVVIVAAGVVDIAANQEGNSNFFPAATITKTLTIQKAQQILAITSVSLATYGGPFVSLTANSTSGLPVTTFSSQYDTIASVDNTQLTIRGAGTSVITAYQQGNQNYLPKQTTQEFTVKKATQAITFSPLPSQSLSGPPYIMSATASSGMAVSFKSLRNAVAVTSGNSLRGQGLGTAVIVASQSGNSNYLPAPNVNQNVTIAGTTSAFQMYGSTRTGGSGKGTLFRLKSDGTDMTTTFNFPANANGLPNGGLLKASDNKLYGVIMAGGNPSNGIVFSMNTDGSGYSVIHNFSNTDGSFPTGNVIEASNGYLYGATMYGGLNAGVIYRLQKDGTNFSVLHEFSSSYNGSAGLLQAADGKLYGATLQGGSAGYGALYSINLDGSGYTEFLSFDGVSKGSTPRGALVQGPDLFMYGVTSGGGSLGYGVLFKVKTDGTSYTKLVEFDGTATGAYGASSPVIGGDGKLYAMTQRGGASGNGIIFSVATNGNGFVKVFEFDGVAGSHPVGPLMEASDGFLYGMTSEGGTANLGTAFKIMKNGNSLLKLQDFIGSNGSNNGAAQLGPFLEVQSGLFLGITYRGGASDAGIIFSLTPTGTFNLFKDFPQPASLPDILVVNNDFTRTFGIASAGGAYGGGAVFSAKNDGSDYTTIANLQGDFLYASSLTHISDNSLWGVGREGWQTFNYFLFKLDENGSNFQRIALNDPAIAADPRSLVDFSTDYIYGASANGGINSNGTIFKIKKDGSGLAKVTDIPGGALGSRPYVQVIKHSNGALYGVTHEGGANDNGAVFKVSPEGIYTKIADLKQSLTGAYPKRIIELNGGSLCIATGNGGANDRGCLFVVEENGQNLEKIFDFTLQTGSTTNNMVQSAEGYIFVALASEGAQNRGTIIRVLPDGSGYLKLADFTPANGSEPNSIMFEKQVQSITSFDDIPQKQFVAPPFLINATSSSGALVRFTSSDPSIASVDGHQVTIHNLGTLTISAQVPASGNYTPSSIVQKTLTIVKSDQQLTFSDIPQKKFGDPDFKLVVSTTSQLPVSLSSSNTAVATIRHGRVNIVGAGTTTINASVASDPNFNPVSPQQKLLTVIRNNQTIQFDPIATHYVDAAPFTLSATSTSSRFVTFASDNQTVATVSGTLISLHAAGQAIITASASGDLNYADAISVNKTLTVRKHDQSIDFDVLKDRHIEDLSFSIQGGVASSGLPVTLTNTSSHISISGNIVSILKAGSVTVNASQEGNSIFLPALQISRTFCIIPSKPLLTKDSVDISKIVLTSSATEGNQWFKNGTLMAGEDSRTLTVRESGIYRVRITVEGCSGSLSDPVALIVTGVEDQPDELAIYPNPSETQLFVRLPYPGTSDIRLINLMGRELQRLQSSESIAEINVASIPSGVYLIQVRVGTVVALSRFVKK